MCKRRYTEILHRADRVLLLSAIGGVIYLAKQTASCSVCRGTKTRAIARAFRGRSVCWRARTSLRETINYHWPLVDRAMSRCSLPAPFFHAILETTLNPYRFLCVASCELSFISPMMMGCFDGMFLFLFSKCRLSNRLTRLDSCTFANQSNWK